MPTTRPRHMITETDEVGRALADAAHRWPEDRDRPAKLLLALVREGHLAILDAAHAIAARKRAAILETAGALSGTYPAGYLDALRDDWPA